MVSPSFNQKMSLNSLVLSKRSLFYLLFYLAPHYTYVSETNKKVTIRLGGDDLHWLGPLPQEHFHFKREEKANEMLP